ncbi:hypothetical protein [Streptomyces vietnamensis]|uniref:Secreted protein n=1 Tax=Streptomyces vietnamensis TaxID=362257 RepID=A0A0B5HWQ0_9ACTN|nr:hypothetical protein [Streptomyces vietnamensis]AJF64871.1 hypothetical protein SVTN_10950 [Streptomyces vietnamensis]
MHIKQIFSVVVGLALAASVLLFAPMSQAATPSVTDPCAGQPILTKIHCLAGKPSARSLLNYYCQVAVSIGLVTHNNPQLEAYKICSKIVPVK